MVPFLIIEISPLSKDSESSYDSNYGRSYTKNRLSPELLDSVSTYSMLPKTFFGGPKMNLLVVVTSAPGHLHARRLIRETWGSKQMQNR